MLYNVTFNKCLIYAIKTIIYLFIHLTSCMSITILCLNNHPFECYVKITLLCI